MVDNRGGRIPEALAAVEQTVSKLGLFVADQAVAASSQVRAKVSIFFEHTLAEGHVGAKGRAVEFSGLVSQIEKDNGSTQVEFAAHVQPGRRCETFFGANAASRAGPAAVLHGSGQI